MKNVTTINPAIRVLKAASCPSLSGKSTLSYQVGYGVIGNITSITEPEIQLRIYANTGGGFFNKDWIPLSSIQQLLDKNASNKPITSNALYPLFKNRSINTPAFLLAVLKYEGFLRPLKDKQRGYERLEPTEFMTEIKALIETMDSATTEAISSGATEIDNKPKQSIPSKPIVAAKKAASKAAPSKA